MNFASLPQVVKTQKTSSLPDDLKNIAAQLIADKFGIKEKKPQSSWGEFPSGQGGPAAIFNQSNMDGGFWERQRGYRDGITVKEEPWSRRRIASVSVSVPSFAALESARRRLLNENIRHDMIFVMEPEFFRALMCDDPDFSAYFMESYMPHKEGVRNVSGQIMGIDVQVTPALMGCVLEATF